MTANVWMVVGEINVDYRCLGSARPQQVAWVQATDWERPNFLSSSCRIVPIRSDEFGHVWQGNQAGSISQQKGEFMLEHSHGFLRNDQVSAGRWVKIVPEQIIELFFKTRQSCKQERKKGIRTI